jgi:hypothetical protein
VLESRRLLSAPPATVAPGTGTWLTPDPFNTLDGSSTISDPAVQDVWAYMPNVSGAYVISTDGALDTQIRVYNSAGNPTTPIIDDNVGGESTTQTLTAGQWAYVAVGGYQTNLGDYNLHINGPDRTRAVLATPAPANSGTVSGSVASQGDLHYYAITAPASATTVDLTITPGASLDTYPELFDSGGNLLQALDTQGTGAADSNLGIAVTGGATYYVGVSAYQRTMTGSYTLAADFNPDPAATASISGTIWSDVNSNKVLEPTEPHLANWTVFLDQNQNHVLDPGEAFTTSDSSGNYTFTGLAAGTYYVEEQMQPGFTQTFPGSAGATNTPVSSFNVDVTFIDSTLTPTEQQAFTTAANRWQQIITTDIPNVTASDGKPVDDIRIDASGPAIDGVGGILGQAGPTELRSGSFLPLRGTMQFDQADLANLQANGQLVDVITHEMAHVLGFGTIWSAKGLVTGAGGTDPRFTGVHATAEYDSIFGVTDTSVPVENTGGPGTRDSHWRESVFRNELMTGFLNSGVDPLSRVTAAQMQDIGYTGVNLDAADAYNKPASLRAQLVATGSQAVAGTLLSTSGPYIINRSRVRNATAALLPNAHTITLTAGQAVTGRNFGNHQNNTQPMVAAITTQNAVEGLPFTVSGSFTDPDSGDSWTATVNFGSGTEPLTLNADKTFTINHTFADNGTFPVTVSVTDSHRSTGATMFNVVVSNVAPKVSQLTPPAGQLIAGGLFSSSGTFTDPGADTWTATVNYGDGGAAVPLFLVGTTFSLSHTYASPGAYNVAVAVTDKDNDVGTSSLAITVIDPPGVTRDSGASYAITDLASAAPGKTLTITAGTVTFASDIAATYPNLTIKAGAGASALFAADEHLSALILTAGGAAAESLPSVHANRHHLVIGTLGVDAASSIDLTGNDMIVQSGGISAIETLVARGFHNGDWKGSGLTSSAAAGDPLSTTALGAAAAGDIGATTFDGEAVASTDVLIKYTYYGDADLSGSVTGDDESLVLFGLHQGGAGHWAFGDFDYSGHVTGDDYSLFLAGLRKQPAL